MNRQVAIIGAGVSGLTCVRAFGGAQVPHNNSREEIGQQTTSGAAAALWFPYDAEPAEKVSLGARSYKPWSILPATTTPASRSSVAPVLRTGEVQIPDWRSAWCPQPVFLCHVERSRDTSKLSILRASKRLCHYRPLMDTTIYLDYLADRFVAAGGINRRKCAFRKTRRTSIENSIW